MKFAFTLPNAILVREDGTTKANWDVGIALDVFEAAPLCDTVILASGDGDFIPIDQRLLLK